MRIKAFGKTELLRTKTDRVDAMLIARFCALHRPPRGGHLLRMNVRPGLDKATRYLTERGIIAPSQNLTEPPQRGDPYAGGKAYALYKSLTL